MSVHKSSARGNRGSSEPYTYSKKTIGGQGCLLSLGSSFQDVSYANQLSQYSSYNPWINPPHSQILTPFSSVSVDLFSSLPLSHGFDSVMVMVDHGLMKRVIFCPCTKEIDTAGIALLFFHHVFPQFGLHSKLISDQGPQFSSTFT